MKRVIALAYNLKRPVREIDSVPLDFYSEFDSADTIEAIAKAIREGGHIVHLVEATEDLPRWFLTNKVDLVFNIAEGSCGSSRESQVPAVLESLGIPFTGSSSTTLALALDKARTKQLLSYEGIPTPLWQLFDSPKSKLNPNLDFPLIVKPNREGSAKGIGRESVVHDEPSLRKQINRIIKDYHQSALVEEFIEGIELTVGILGNDSPKVLPILEIDFENCNTSGEFFYSWRMKEYQGNQELGLNPAFHCPARLDPGIAERVKSVALSSHKIIGCRDISRVDIRLSKKGVPFVLEINPLPGLDPHESNFPIMTTAAGISYPAFINHMVDLVIERCNGYARVRESVQNPSAVALSA